MKRYALFAYDTYYPSGGWHDFLKSYASIEDALTVAKAEWAEHQRNFHIVDLQEGIIMENIDD